MPRLHKYRDKNACYVLTAIRGAVITYQLTPDGERKLNAAGIACGQKFERALLLDLYRTGDAFTRGSGVNDPALTSQIELDFTNDPDPETAFPACDVCRSVNDLHLTLTGKPTALVAQIQCAECCVLPAAARSETIIPLGLLSRPILSRLYQIRPVPHKSPGVKQFEELLRTEFEAKWEALRKRRGATQTSLFDTGPSDGLNLFPSAVDSQTDEPDSPASFLAGHAIAFARHLRCLPQTSPTMVTALTSAITAIERLPQLPERTAVFFSAFTGNNSIELGFYVYISPTSFEVGMGPVEPNDRLSFLYALRDKEDAGDCDWEELHSWAAGLDNFLRKTPPNELRFRVGDESHPITLSQSP